jgi:hypothetical protein
LGYSFQVGIVYIEGPFRISNSKWHCFASHAAFDFILAQLFIASKSYAMAAVYQSFNALCN